ncbi:MAG: hypothetical protein IJ867_01690 [Clostridia bacterium]|nr:hypothetical protein [Clostridia bacterium]
MRRKIVIMIIVMICTILGICIFVKQNKTVVITGNAKSTMDSSDIIKYDTETELYYIRDEQTNEIVAASKFEDDLVFYKDHPNYQEDPLKIRSTDLKEFLNVDEQ